MCHLKGWKSSGLTDHLDVVATLLEIAGAEPMKVSHGRSLIPQIEAGPDAPGAQRCKDVIFSEVAGYSMVRTERYKLAIDAMTQKPCRVTGSSG